MNAEIIELVDELSAPLRKAKGISDLATSAHGPDSDSFRAAAWAVSDLIGEAQEAMKRHGGDNA